MIFSKSIARRWFLTTLGVVFVIFAVFIVVMSFTVQAYSYNGIEQALIGRGDELLNIFYTNSGYSTSAEFATVSRNYIENFPDKNSMEIMAISRNGNVTISSTGFAPNQEQPMPDYADATGNENGYGYWVGKLETGEKVMAVTRCVRDSSGSLIGSIRYIVSLERADSQTSFTVIILVAVGLFVLLIITLSGLYFIRSIVVPIRGVAATSRRIAEGDFDVRLEKLNDDELGDLIDAINDMASELGASEKMKNDFISSVSHELRTPLTSIKGWAETLHSGEVSHETAEKGMNVIIRESERLSGIVEELLDFSRLQNGRMQLRMQRLDLLAELDEAVFMFTDRAATEKKDLIYEENTSLPPVLGDVNRLRQVFVNVIDNALKYTGEHGKITVSSGVENGGVFVRVSDTGCGIPPEHLPNVKKKFYKANQLVKGSGIGLAVADEIISMHNGTLDIDSKVDAGTTVTITLPAADRNSPAQNDEVPRP